MPMIRAKPSSSCVLRLAVFCLRHRRLEWIPDDEPDFDWFNRPRNPSNPDPEGFDQLVLRSPGEGVSPTWQAPEIQLDDGRTLVLEYT